MSSPSKPPITVLITCYNGGDLILRAVASLDRQTDADFDTIVVDDVSTDPVTIRALAGLEDRARTRVLRRSVNGGQSAARNDAFAAAPDDAVCVPLDRDDELPPGAIERIRREFAGFPDTGYVWSDYEIIDAETGESRVVDCSALAASDGSPDVRALVRYWTFYGGSPCRKSVWRDAGGYNLEYTYGGCDVDFWLAVFERGTHRGRYVAEVLYRWHRSASGLNATRIRERPDAEKRMHTEHLALMDRLGLGAEIRRRAMKEAVVSGDGAAARRWAAQLARIGFDPAAMAVRSLPWSWVHAAYRHIYAPLSRAFRRRA